MIEAIITLQMDRPITKSHYISPGEMEVKLKDGSRIQFDFLGSEKAIDAEETEVVHYRLGCLDKSAFPEAAHLCERMKDVVQLSECYVYTGEHTDPEINLLAIRDFEIIDYSYTGNYLIESTEYVTAKADPRCGARFKFTRRALDEVDIY